MKFSRLDLPKEQRKQFSQRLLTLYHVLGESDDAIYNHDFIVRYAGAPDKNQFDEDFVHVYPAQEANTCGTAACALGHAIVHHERFEGLPVKRDLFGRPQELDDGRLLHAAGYASLTAFFRAGHRPDQVADLYFGPGAWDNIFSVDAYQREHGRRPVTRAMAMQRILDYIQTALGCTPIE